MHADVIVMRNNELRESNLRKISEFREQLNDPEFRKQYENKQRQVQWYACLIRLFCCPCIVLRNLTRL